MADEDKDEAAWEQGVCETMTGDVKSSTEIGGWEALQNQIKYLKKQHRSLALSQINQLMILWNFGNLAMLCLKGLGHMSATHQITQQWHEKSHGSIIYFARHVHALARYYQVFEQLPPEIRGSSKNAQSCPIIIEG